MRRGYAKRQDKNHNVIRDYLKSHGVDVIEILKPLDLLCRHRSGYISFLEIKCPPKDHCSRTQLAFIATTRFPVQFVRSEEEALLALETQSQLTQTQKDGIQGLLLRNIGKDDFTSKQVREAMECL